MSVKKVPSCAKKDFFFSKIRYVNLVCDQCLSNHSQKIFLFPLI